MTDHPRHITEAEIIEKSKKYVAYHSDTMKLCGGSAQKLLDHIADLEDEMVELHEYSILEHCHPNNKGWRYAPPHTRERNNADRLVSLHRWEKHPTQDGLYRPIDKDKNDA